MNLRLRIGAMPDLFGRGGTTAVPPPPVINYNVADKAQQSKQYQQFHDDGL